MRWYLFFFSITFLEDSALVVLARCVLFRCTFGTQCDGILSIIILHGTLIHVHQPECELSASSESQTLSHKGASYLF